MTISVKEKGPLVASLLIESDAPGCKKLTREVRIVDGLDYLEIIDTVDKLPVRAVEGVHFGFAFNVPNPVVHVNSPGAVIEPEKDQLPGACKNWLEVERWVDVSNDKYGVTWVTSDAPLLELGGLTANLPRGQPDPNVYMKHIEPSATLYSWVMNNHWHTNYRADQEGEVTFHYYLRPHAAYDPVEAAKFGIETTESLIPIVARYGKPLAFALASRRSGCHRQRDEAERRWPGDHRSALRRFGQGRHGNAQMERPRAEEDLAQRRWRAAPFRSRRAYRSARLGNCNFACGVAMTLGVRRLAFAFHNASANE